MTTAERQGQVPEDPPPAWIDVLAPAKSGPKVDPLAFEKIMLRALENLNKIVMRDHMVMKYIEQAFANLPTSDYQGDIVKTLKERMQYAGGVNPYPEVANDIQVLRGLLKIEHTQITVEHMPT